MYVSPPSLAFTTITILIITTAVITLINVMISIIITSPLNCKIDLLNQSYDKLLSASELIT